MPTYKYKCRDCESTFTIKSTIKEKNEGLKLVCPECEGKDVFQMFDSIGVVGGGSKTSVSCSQTSCPSGCNGC
ncbi:MAG: FmdB family zinc ribbon protein [Bacillota bacterium]